jgi:hypothetical protein
MVGEVGLAVVTGAAPDGGQGAPAVTKANCPVVTKPICLEQL